MSSVLLLPRIKLSEDNAQEALSNADVSSSESHARSAKPSPKSFTGAMRMRLATRPSSQRLGPPLGGTSGNWRYRFFRFHVPLAFASVVIIFVWMTLPLFQAAGHQAPLQVTSQSSDHQGSSQEHGQEGGHQSPQIDGQTTDHQGGSLADGANPPMDHSGNQTAILDGTQNRAFMGRFTTATGYLATGLLAFTLLIGTANLLLHRRNPMSSYLRRDAGTWTAIVKCGPCDRRISGAWRSSSSLRRTNPPLFLCA